MSDAGENSRLSAPAAYDQRKREFGDGWPAGRARWQPHFPVREAWSVQRPKEVPKGRMREQRPTLCLGFMNNYM